MSNTWPALDHLAEITTLASLGLNEKQIANRLNLHPDVFRFYRNKHPEVNDAIQQGLSHTIELATTQLNLLIQQGDFKAIKFFLEKKGGWGDHIQFEVNKPTNKSFNLVPIKAGNESTD
jgi:hypothetical protein